jgi:hypothetical protein
MRMPFSHALEVLNGELPEFARFTFLYIVERARRLLANCDLKDSKERLEDLDWFPLSLDPDRFIPEAAEKLRDVEPHERDATQPSLVYQHRDEFDEDDRKGFTWSEYFALMALNCVSQVWLYESIFSTTEFNGSEHIQYLPNTLAHFVAEAAEAACLGEQLLEKEKPGDSSALLGNKQIRERNSAAAEKHHEQIARLKQEWFTYYEMDDFPNEAAAARQFLSELMDEQRRVLAPTNAERTLLEALRVHLRSARGRE